MELRILGPLMLTSRVLLNNERALLFANDQWGSATLEPDPVRAPFTGTLTTLFVTPGDSFTHIETVTDVDGAAYPLAGCKLWFTVKRRRTDADINAIAALAWVSGLSSTGITVDDLNTGVVTITIPPTGTLGFVQAAHYWDLQLQEASGAVRTVASGMIVVRRGVTTRTTTP